MEHKHDSFWGEHIVPPDPNTWYDPCVPKYEIKDVESFAILAADKAERTVKIAKNYLSPLFAMEYNKKYQQNQNIEYFIVKVSDWEKRCVEITEAVLAGTAHESIRTLHDYFAYICEWQ